jgi:cytochrome c
MHITVLVAALFLSIAASRFVHAAGDATRGEQLYESRCIACHSLDANRVGPLHRGVYGRKAGSVPDFVYSAALVSSTIVWSDTTLNRWLTDPEALIPGQRMNFRVMSADDRADIIAFLRRESGR